MSKVTVDVTQEDIDHGESNNCYNCPVARAAVRALGQTAVIAVSANAINVFGEDGTRELVIALPIEATQFIDTVDRCVDEVGSIAFRKVVKPFSFEVEVPDAEQQ